MESSQDKALYRVWGAEKAVYGPFDLARLGQWAKEGRVTEGSWVFLEAANEWKRAVAVPELKPLFSADTSGDAAAPGRPAGGRPSAGLAPEAFRSIKLFAGLEVSQLASFAQYLEVVRVPQFGNLVRKGERGDAMYVVLQGELRVLSIIEGKECLISTLGAGDFFGEIALLDQGPRSADVIANRDSTLLKLSSTSFERLIQQAPALAMPFVLALSRAVVGRIRRTTKRYEDSVQFILTSGSRR